MYKYRLTLTCLLSIVFSFFTINYLQAQLAPSCSAPPFIEQNSHESIRLLPCDGPISDFRYDVAIDGDWAALSISLAPGGGAVYMYHFDGTNWTAHSKLTPSTTAAAFGEHISLKNDKLLVGAPGFFSSPGAAFLFAFNGTTWEEKLVFNPPAGFSTFNFGRGLEINEDPPGFDLIYIGGRNLVSVYRIDASYNIIGQGNLPDNFNFGNQIIAQDDWLYILGKKCYMYRYNGSRYEIFQNFSSVSDGPDVIAMDANTAFFNVSPFCGACRGFVRSMNFDGSNWVSEDYISDRPNFEACGHTGGFGGDIGREIHAEDNNLFIYADDRRFKQSQAGVIYWYQRATAADDYELRATYSNPAVKDGVHRVGSEMDYDNGRLIMAARNSVAPFEVQAYIIETDKVCMPPQILNASPSPGGVTLSWNAVPGASKYKIRVKDCNSFSDPSDDVLIATQSTTGTSLFFPLASGSYKWDIETDCSMNTSERFGNFSNSFFVPSPRQADESAAQLALAQEEIFVSPNPASGLVQISSNTALENIWVADLSGRAVEVEISRLSDQAFQLDVSQLSTGLYFVLGESTTNQHRTKLLVK